MSDKIVCPTKEQILEAAKTDVSVRHALEKLFPAAFEPVIKKGQIYSWGTDSDEISGLVTEYAHQPDRLSLVNFLSGKIIVQNIPNTFTKSDLFCYMKEVAQSEPSRFGNCVLNELKGPKYLRSWTFM